MDQFKGDGVASIGEWTAVVNGHNVRVTQSSSECCLAFDTGTAAMRSGSHDFQSNIATRCFVHRAVDDALATVAYFFSDPIPSKCRRPRSHCIAGLRRVGFGISERSGKGIEKIFGTAQFDERVVARATLVEMRIDLGRKYGGSGSAK
jgi:hypothetical protein